MSRAPYVIVAGIVAASIAWTIHLGGEPDPLAIDSALSIAVGLVVFSVIDAAGLLLSRGRWARRLGFVLTASGAALFVLTELTVMSLAALALSGLSLLGLAGPWLDGWIRKRPAAGGPGVKPLGVVFGLLALIPLAGAVTPSGMTPWHGLIGGAGVLLAWSYSKAQVWALWAVRLALGVVALPAIVNSPPAGALLLAAAVTTTVAFAWFRESLIAVAPLLERLPGPRVHRVGVDSEPDHE
jgi:hypothetical protein